MKITIKWLKEYVNFDDTVEGLANRLTMSGFEVESIERTKDDVVLDINVTPNRPDCLSVFGIAREVSALYGSPTNFPEHDFVADTGELDFNVDILDPELCHRYAGRVIKNVKIAPSPKWLQDRLMNCGIRSINNVVDITNYVLLELGHPLHAFDLAKLKGKKIVVASAQKVKKQGHPLKITLLDGSERELQDDMLLINDGERPVALAGIMGGANSEVTEQTKDLFIESAWFHPASIRKTSRALGIKTESSYRFERGADIRLLKKALDRTALLIHKFAGGTIGGKIDIYPKRHQPPTIRLTFDRIDRFVGMNIPKKEVLKILTSLGLEVEAQADEITVRPPSSRNDLQRDVDLIEEIVRIYGYDKVPSIVPQAPLRVHSEDACDKEDIDRLINTCKTSLLNSGYNEVINYSFIGPQDLDLLQIPSDDRRRRTINILNPLRQEDSMMRTTLIPSLVRNLVTNLSYGIRDIRLFEIARVFLKGQPDKQIPEEPKHLALLLTLDRERSLYKDDTEDFFVMKGHFESIFEQLKMEGIKFVRSTEPFLHPGRSADIVVVAKGDKNLDKATSKDGSYKIGFVGNLSPQVKDALPVKMPKQEVIVAELSLHSLHAFTTKKAPSYAPIPQFPFVDRDTAIVVDDALEIGTILDLLQSLRSEIIEDMRLFDVYKGKGIPEGKKSVAFTVRYRSKERTLSDSEVEELHQSLVDRIIQKTGGVLRG